MASSNFPRFQELAIELQLQVWKEAASPDGQVLLDPSFIMGPQLNGFTATFFRITSPRLLPFRTIDRNRTKYTTTAEARTTLMATCRLSRLAVLESWWDDIVEISFRRTLLDPYQLPWLKEERDVMIRSYGILLHKLLSSTEAGKVYAIDDRSHLLARDGRVMCALLPGRTAKPNNIWMPVQLASLCPPRAEIAICSKTLLKPEQICAIGLLRLFTTADSNTSRTRRPAPKYRTYSHSALRGLRLSNAQEGSPQDLQVQILVAVAIFDDDTPLVQEFGASFPAKENCLQSDHPRIPFHLFQRLAKGDAGADMKRASSPNGNINPHQEFLYCIVGGAGNRLESLINFSTTFHEVIVEFLSAAGPEFLRRCRDAETNIKSASPSHGQL